MEKLLFGRYTVMTLKKLQTYFQKNMERTVWRLSLVILLIAIAKILLLASKIEKYGLTLTASNTVVYYSNSYDLEIRLQSEDRAHRISQTKKVTYIDLISDGTIDEFIVKNLRGKINLATKVLGEELKKWLI